MEYKSEDIVREESKTILGFEDTESAKSGVGQLTSWSKLGFKGEKGCPDGWYLPNIHTYPAIIAEFKANNVSLNNPQIVTTQYPLHNLLYSQITLLLSNSE